MTDKATTPFLNVRWYRKVNFLSDVTDVVIQQEEFTNKDILTYITLPRFEIPKEKTDLLSWKPDTDSDFYIITYNGSEYLAKSEWFSYVRYIVKIK